MILQGRIDDLQRELAVTRDSQEKRLQDHMDMVAKRLEDVQQSSTQRFSLLTILFTVFAALGAVFGFTSFFVGRYDYKKERDSYETRMETLDEQHKDDYRKERAFYETRITSLDQQQKAVVSQQVELGDTVLKRSDEMLSKQIDSIAKLGAVIDMVKKSLDLQITREEDLKKVNAIVASMTRNYQQLYDAIQERISPLQKISRMGWANIESFQVQLAAGARADFRGIPDFYKEELEKNDSYELARIYEILGASAFYANDIDYAEDLLSSSVRVYEKQPIRQDHVVAFSAAHLFLGLICKSWLERNRRLEDNLAEARKHLEKARDLLKDRKDEFLVPVTLAEVRSYSEADRAEVVKEVKSILKAMRGLHDLNDNQKRLKVRALMILGNVEEGAQRAECYSEAIREEPNNPYPILCLAFVTSDSPARKELFQKGLVALTSTKFVEKPEVTTRATAIAWAAIANEEVNNPDQRDRFLKMLETLSQSASISGGRLPLAFCPITRMPCTFDVLLEQVKSIARHSK